MLGVPTLAAILLLVGCASTAPDPAVAEAAIRAKVARYAESIDAASREMAAEAWLQSEEASFIHPRGEESGWQAIADNFVGKVMGGNFSKRKLTVQDVDVRLLGDTAVALSNWQFNATRRADDVEIQTTGRESQVFIRRDGDWALVHVHYSGPPRTAAGEGF